MGTGARKGLTQDELKNAVRDELAGSFGVLNTNKGEVIPPDELFYSALRTKKNGRWVLEKTQILGTYWHIEDRDWTKRYIEVPSPPENYHLSLYTKNSWKYPWGGVNAKLPSSLSSGSFWLFGFEPGPGETAGLISFFISGDKLYAHCDGVSNDITSYLPSDYSTAIHIYQIKVNHTTAEFYIDRSLVAVAIRRGIELSAVSGPPYNIFGTKYVGFDEAPAFAELCRCDVDTYYLDPGHFRAMSGDPLPPRHYDLYSTGTNTKWAGNSFDSAITSHPVPVWGYSKKCFLFQSNAAGTIAIEVYAGGGWREVVSETVTANSLWDYVLNLEVPLARMKYTPTNSDSIAVAECNLS